MVPIPKSDRSDLPVIFLMGSTASGKTELAAGLCDRFPVEVVSVDAVQVYRGLDIGTAKPPQSFLDQYPHSLIDIRNPEDPYSAADFVRDAKQCIAEIHQRRRIPLLVGGTMFYFSALEYGLSVLPSTDLAVRDRLREEMDAQGVPEMYRQLQAVDPLTAARIDMHDGQRILRALEIYQITGTPPNELMQAPCGLTKPPVKFALFRAFRNQLHALIQARFNNMLKSGLVDEVIQIAATLNKPDHLPSMRSVGYRQVLEMLQGETKLEEMTEKAIAATRQLAKRQLTWLRQQRGLVWVQKERDALDAVSKYWFAHPWIAEFCA